MRKILCTLIAFVWVTSSLAQTGLEILNRMNERINSHDADGVSMFIDIKIPVLGTVTTKTLHLGDKTRMEIDVSGEKIITFLEDTIQWVYIPSKNEASKLGSTQKSNNPAADSGMNIGLFNDVAEGYDISIKSENLVKWELACKKKRSHPDKDAPKNITIEVRKETYNPLSFSSKIMGLTFTMRDFTFGVSEDQVVFNPDNFPGVRIVEQQDSK